MPLATWAGPYDALLSTGGVIHVGDTLDVTDGDLQSAYWPAFLGLREPVAPVPTSPTTPGSDG